MIYKSFIIENTFEAGVAVGSLRSFLAGQGAGELNVVASGEPGVLVEISAHNPAVMSYAEDRLADFV